MDQFIDPNNLKPNISSAQPSKFKPQVTKTHPSKLIPQTVKTQPSKLKPLPPKPHSPVTQRTITSNSFAVLEDLDLGDDCPHDFSQQQLNFETKYPYSQGSDFFDSISSTDVDDPPEFEPRSYNNERDNNSNLMSDTPNQINSKQVESAARVECP